MEAHGDLLGRDAIGLEVFHHRQRATARQVTVGQTIATIVGMAIELNAIDAGVSLEKAQDDVQLGLGQRLQCHPTAGKAHLALAHLIEVHR